MKIFLFLLLLVPLVSFGQEGDQPELLNAAFEAGPFIGNLLPNQIDGVTEIHPQWGWWTGFGLGGAGTAEINITSGNGNGVEWSSLSTSLRMDVPIENLIGIVYIGANVSYYKGVDMPKKLFGGGHVGGGVMTPLSKLLYFRADMKFHVNPGTSLLIMGGFLFRFPGGEGGGADD